MILIDSEFPTAANARHSHEGVARLGQVAVTTQWWLCEAPEGREEKGAEVLVPVQI